MDLKPVLQIERLNFRFDERVMFAQFSVDLGTGITWLRGANGAGKTTLLKLLAGVLSPQSGAIRLDGADSRRAALAYRLSCFYCGADLPQLPWLTAQELLDLHLALYPAADAAALNDQLTAFDLLPALRLSLTALSLGQHKKLQLALALALPVRLLLIDEPFNGLDAAAMLHLREQLSDPLRLANSCVVLTSHLEPRVPLVRTLELAGEQGDLRD
jgi:ABC-2 type transport system ATP-binding protein